MRKTLSPEQRCSGFTLVELLTVIGIISVMAVIIGLGLSGGNESISVGNAQRISSSIFQSARSNALLQRRPTRVIIYADEMGDPRKFLRYMGVVVLEEGADPATATASQWEPVNNGTYLPSGVFFMPNTPDSTAGIDTTNEAGATVLGSTLTTTGTNPASFEFPVTGSPDRFYYYEFDENGMSENPGDTFVVCAGRVASEGAAVQIKIDNPFATAGFALRRIGGTTLFNSYDELELVNANSN